MSRRRRVPRSPWAVVAWGEDRYMILAAVETRTEAAVLAAQRPGGEVIFRRAWTEAPAPEETEF